MNRSRRILAWPAFKPKLSPYNALLYKAMQQLGATVEEFTGLRVLLKSYDVLHLHWPEYCVNQRGRLPSVFWSSALFVAMFWVRVRGGFVIWTVHNLESHMQRYPAMERCFWKIFTSLLNGYICLTKESSERAREWHPALRNKKVFVIPHGNIRDAYSGTDISRERARSRLGIPQSTRVLVFFGSIQPYKGVTELVEAFTAMSDPDAALLVAGKCFLGRVERNRLESIAYNDRRVTLHLEYIAHDDVPCYLRAADLVVLPFREVLNSGSAILSLALDRAVLVPDKGTMDELQRFAGTDWVRVYKAPLTPELLQTELSRAVTRLTSNKATCCVLQNGWDGLQWNDLAQLTLEAYDCVRGVKGTTTNFS